MMAEYLLLTEEELDAMLPQSPRYDLDAVKRRTLARVEDTASSAQKRLPLRGLLIAAVVCALSLTTIAAADHVTGGKITKALGIRKEPVEAVAGPEAEVPSEEVSAEEPALPEEPPEPQPEPPQPEPPLLDAQIAGALQMTGEQTAALRPAVQNVEQAAEQQDIRMTVLQTLGDPACLYIKVRFDFPEGVPVSEELEFESRRVEFDRSNSYSKSWEVLERTGNAVTCLLKINAGGGAALQGQTVTLTVENYGRPKDAPGNSISLVLRAEETRRVIIDPQGNVNAEVTEEALAALSAPVRHTDRTQAGFAMEYLEDGHILVTYDGTQGESFLTVIRGETPEVLVGENPKFERVLEGKWSLTWTLDYQDLSRRWSGEKSLIDPSLTLTGIRLSPLSWDATFVGDEFAPLYLSDVLGGWTAQLRHGDGTLTALKHTGSGMDVSDDKAVYTITTGQVFSQPVDLEDITAIVIEGEEFLLK